MTRNHRLVLIILAVVVVIAALAIGGHYLMRGIIDMHTA